LEGPETRRKPQSIGPTSTSYVENTGREIPGFIRAIYKAILRFRAVKGGLFSQSGMGRMILVPAQQRRSTLNTYFLIRTDARVSAFRTANIPVEDFRIGRQDGLVFNEAHLPRVLEALHSEVESRRPTQYEGITAITLQRAPANRATANRAATPAAPPPSASRVVTVAQWSREASERIREQYVAIARDFVSLLRTPEIVIHDNREAYRGTPAVLDGKFHIQLWSSLVGEVRTVGGPFILWGETLSERAWNIRTPSGQGIRVEDDAGVQIGELVQNNLYIFYPITNSDFRNSASIFRKILEEAVFLRTATDEQKAARARRREQVLVRVMEWNASSAMRAEFLAVATELAPAFGKQMVLHAWNSYHDKAPYADGKMHVCINASPHLNGDGHMRSELFGASLRFVSNAEILAPSGDGVTIKDEDGNQVGEVVGETIYIHYALVREELGIAWDGKPASALFRRILEEAAFMMTATDEEKAARSRQQARQTPVRASNWSGASALKVEFVAVATELAPAFGGKQVIIHDDYRREKSHAPENDGRVHVCIFSSPNYRTHRSMSQTLFGARLAWGRDCKIVRPSGEGLLIEDDAGNQVGELIGDSLYIHYPLSASADLRLSWDGKSVSVLFRKILEETITIMTATPEEKAAREEDRRQKRRAASREAYMKACARRIEKTIEGTKRAIKDNETRVNQLQEELVKCIREGNGARRKLEQLEASNAGVEEGYGKEFDNLLEVDKVRDVRIEEGAIEVFTDILYCVDPRSKKKHEIGAFRIEVGLNGQVRWFNLTRKINGHDAPHVFSGDGSACLGNMHEILPELVANYEFAALAMVAIQFIESVNTDDSAGKHISDWPVAA